MFKRELFYYKENNYKNLYLNGADIKITKIYYFFKFQ